MNKRQDADVGRLWDQATSLANRLALESRDLAEAGSQPGIIIRRHRRLVKMARQRADRRARAWLLGL